MNKISKIIRDVVLHSKYCLPNESRLAMINRNKNMHINKFPSLKHEIDNAYIFVLNDQILPSMRSLQYGGREIEMANNKIYNCAFRAIDDLDAFGEIMYLLLGGTGVGISVQYQHVSKLPMLRGKLSAAIDDEVYVVSNKNVGWACAIDAAISQYYCGPSLRFDYSKLTNGKPLETCIKNIERVFDGASRPNAVRVGGQMRPIDYHDVICFIAQASTERAALISLFSENDNDMINAKTGEWWKTNPQRSQSNNSIILDRGNLKRGRFEELWKIISLNKYGEPGFYFANDLNNGTNPCAEITLKSKQFCNLVEVNVASVTSQEELNSRSRAAAFIATLQASYTDFAYLSREWKSTTEEDALIGVSMTGIAAHTFGEKFRFDLKTAAVVVANENIRVAKMIGINPSPRCTTIKPAGSTSIIFGTSSGIHSYHSPYYIRRVRIMKNEELYKFLTKKFPACIEVSDFMNDNMGVIKFPMNAPDGAILRSESVFDIMTRIKHFSVEWIKNGQMGTCVDANSVSATISIKNDEWNKVGEWMWDNRDHYNGLSILPFDNHDYKQAPFTSCSYEEYCKLCCEWDGFEIENVTKKDINFENEPACAGGKCEI